MSGCKHTCEGAEAGRASAATKKRFSVTKRQIRALTLHIFQVALKVRKPALCFHVNFKKEPGVEVWLLIKWPPLLTLFNLWKVVVLFFPNCCSPVCVTNGTPLCSVSGCRLHGKLDLLHGSRMTALSLVVGLRAHSCTHGSNRAGERQWPR